MRTRADLNSHARTSCASPAAPEHDASQDRDTSSAFQEPRTSDILKLAPGMPVLHVIHTARSADGDVLEVSESVWPADRVMLIDEYEITAEAEQPNAQSEI
ncbi:UTRA domain-containing protein [Kribbella sp. NPDC026596]|uniref:UTRA domain-containing protein n=1 Tax=Kribbella sp. NPDC026596 TaxID=3155122 RepID=UPI0033F8867F